ncbi:MAG TPA: immune inhibitor A domain-containing protein [Pilimelia sp.]|nr:immune inhibitor A domain-containing protein [Pilimelia sp.]
MRVSAGLAALAAGLLAVGLTAAPASGAPKPEPTRDAIVDPASATREDNLPHPLAEAQTAMRKEAIAALLAGKAKTQKRNGSDVVQLRNKRFVEYRKAPKVDPIFSILVEFGDRIDAATGGTPGPLHNKIPERDRVIDGSPTDDNSTIWRSNFSRDHYQALMFSKRQESMRDFYRAQSGGRYTVGGDVSDWVKVPFNEARYGSNALPDSAVYWPFVRDTAQAWYDAQLTAGKTPAQIKQYLSRFDIWDRYDYDGDGNFNEPDGYVDHFQAIHAGEGEEAGGGAQGADAIWSHRWYAYLSEVGSTGPDFNKLGGVPLGDSGLWIGDYTTEPENGGLGVFAHEYGHDLGLPDYYDTQGGDNGTGFWSLMSAGSWLNRGKQDIGSTPGYLDPYSKLFLGWLNHTTVPADGGTTHAVLGAAGDSDGPHAQAVVVNLPDQKISTEWNTPYSGQFEWWGGSADDLNATLSRQIDLTGAGGATLTVKAQYEIEEDFDFLFAEASTDGAIWTKLSTTRIDPGEGGLDGSTEGEWVDLSYDLSAYAGKTVQFRFRYQTDGGVHFSGPFLDDFALVRNGNPVWLDTVEAGAAGWTSRGWTRFSGVETKTVPHFYIAENRSYVGYDDALRTGPYNFGWADTRPDFVERFSYNQGMLVWYVNFAYDDNNVSEHPGFGFNLPVDVRPGPITVPDQGNITNRRTVFDAPFGKLKKKAVTLHRNGVPVTVPEMAGVPTFDDSDPERYWTATNEQNSVKVAGSGTKITVLVEVHGYTDLMLVKISN